MNEKGAQEIYDLLIEQNIFEKKGKIIFDFANVCVTINTTDTVGNTIQSWLKQWMISNGILFWQPENTQEFPDFYLGHYGSKENLLEVKSFHYSKSPAFDIANYESYAQSVVEKPYRLDANYIIFGYEMDDDGTISIKNLWLKKIWEIAGTSSVYPLKVQVKKNVIYNIRPNSEFKFYKSPSFHNEIDFLESIYLTQMKYRGLSIGTKWKSDMEESYLKYRDKKIIL